MINYTPLDVESMKKGIVSSPSHGLDINILFLTLILITLVILAGLLFVLIQQRVHELSFGVSSLA